MNSMEKDISENEMLYNNFLKNLSTRVKKDVEIQTEFFTKNAKTQSALFSESNKIAKDQSYLNMNILINLFCLLVDSIDNFGFRQNPF